MKRAEALALIGAHAVGQAIVGLEVDRAGTATLRVEGGYAIVLPAAGGLYFDGAVRPDLGLDLLPVATCDCGHGARWHDDPAGGECTHDDCRCVRFRDPADVRAAAVGDPRGEHDR